MSRTDSLPPGARRLPDGRIKLITDAPPGPDGKRRQRSKVVNTVAEAKTAYAEMRASIDQGTYIAPAGITVDAHLDGWLAGKQLRATTRASYIDALKPARRLLGHRPLQSIRKADVEALMNDITGRGRSGRTANYCLVLLRAALQAAVDEELLPRNVAALVEKRKEIKRRATAWTVEEFLRFKTSIVDHPFRVGFELSCAGLRRGEVVGLRWEDVILDESPPQLIIRHTRVVVAGRTQDSTPKTDRGHRVLPLDAVPDVLDALRAARVRAELHVRAPGATVLAGAGGFPIRPEFYGDQLTRAMRAAGVPVITVHEIRHTSVTLMLDNAKPHNVAAWHGHDPAVMFRNYAHVTQEGLSTAAAALPRLG